MTLSPEAQAALMTIINLRQLARDTGTKTRRTQNEVLQKLNSEDLQAVANELARAEPRKTA
jgi:hypothetical protein